MDVVAKDTGLKDGNTQAVRSDADTPPGEGGLPLPLMAGIAGAIAVLAVVLIAVLIVLRRKRLICSQAPAPKAAATENGANRRSYSEVPQDDSTSKSTATS